MIVRHTTARGGKATVFSVQPAKKAEPQQDLQGRRHGLSAQMK